MSNRDKVMEAVRAELEKTSSGKGEAVSKFLTTAKRRLLIGAGVFAGGATATGAASAAKEEAKRKLAPATALPPGY